MAGPLQSSGGDEHSPISDINVTPFVDVALVLLVIFMITAPAFMKDLIGIQLPKAASADAKAPLSIGIAVNRQGQILMNGQPVGIQDLAREAAKAALADAQTQAIVSADQDARHGDVVKVIDTLKSNGLLRFALEIQREQTP